MDNLDLCVKSAYITRNKGTVMSGFQESPRAFLPKAEARMNFRTQPRIKAAIQQAAALAGMDDSTFTMNAAYQAALATIAAHERTELAPMDHASFFAALDNPSPPTPALIAAFHALTERVE
jgi:uncharacterized protein (DUF1778 family)